MLPPEDKLMGDWFTVEQIDGDTFAISEYKHWEETHCFLLLGNDRAVLIDTGLGVADIRQVVRSLTGLPVQVLTTHAHWDHIGGHALFPDFAVHEAEAEWLSGRFPLPPQAVRQNLLREPCVFPASFCAENYRVFQGTPTTVLHGGERLDLGGRVLTVLHTPGHSPGHCCFYEAGRGYLFSGDLIYRGCLYAFYPTTDPKLFRQSVQAVKGLDIKRILPGHHALEIPRNLIERIDCAFQTIADSGELAQGRGLFDFGDFQIQI